LSQACNALKVTVELTSIIRITEDYGFS